MVRTLTFLALLAVVPAPGQIEVAALYTDFQHPPAPVVLKAIREEVSSLLAPSGLRFEWLMLPTDDLQTWPDLAVITFSGSCMVMPLGPRSLSDRRLGWTQISDGEIFPFCTVDCDAVQSQIFESLQRKPVASRDLVLGRAIGRVTAHELLHIFAKTRHHNTQGVDKPALSTLDLLADRLALEPVGKGSQIIRKSRQPPTAPTARSYRCGQTTFLARGCAVCHGVDAEGTKNGPALRIAGHMVNTIALAAKLTRSQDKMYHQARTLRVQQPSLTEDELAALTCFLNAACR